MKRLILLFFIAAMLLVACTGDRSEAETAIVATEQVLAAEARAAETQAPLPTSLPKAAPKPATEVPTSEPTAELEPTMVASEPPTLTPPSLPNEEAVAVRVISGQTDEGAYFLGDPNAPVTVIDYSDFL